MIRFHQKFYRNGVWALYRGNELVCHIHAELVDNGLVFEAWLEGHKIFTVKKRLDAGARYNIWATAKALQEQETK